MATLKYVKYGVFFQKEENHSAARLPDLPVFFSSTLRLLIPMACTSYGLKPSWPWNKNQISGLKVKKREKSTRNIFHNIPWIATRLGLRIGEFKKIIFFFFDSD